MGQLLIKYRGSLSFLEKKCHDFLLITLKAFLIAYDIKELYKKVELKPVKAKYVRGCPKWPMTQI
jgi:hypothetical protein